MSEVDIEFEEFIDKIKELEPTTKVETIPEVFGIQYKEVYITKWIAYLLRSKSFGVKILNALISINSYDVKIDRIDKVYTEYVFDTKRRIDILIFADKYLIGIENKIWSGEQENQTSDYEESLQKIKTDTGGIEQYCGIYLHPEQNGTKSEFFQNATYTQLYNELKKIHLSEYPDPFEKMMFDQFMLYVKECLYMNNGEFPQISYNVELYAKYINTINAISDEYKSTYSKITDWLKYKFENNEESKYEIIDSAKGYMQLAPENCKDKCKEIGFHFEILWTKDFMLNGEIEIEAHLEKTKDDNIQQIFHNLNITNVEYRGHNKPLGKGGTVSCNFGTEKDAEDTFKNILKALERLRKEHEEWKKII